MNWTPIDRNGYGSYFNILLVNSDKTLIKKVATNDHAIYKLNCEKNFYKFITDNRINFKIPKIIEYGDDYIIMEYINSGNSDNNRILHDLNNLHNSTYIELCREDYIENICIETKYKIISRNNEIKDYLDKYSYIEKVNNINILSYEQILENIDKVILGFIENQREFKFHPIHGDCHHNNVLNDVYIDPRGYFGNHKIYGLKEYDIAKVYFSLSGYNIFDDMSIDSLDIQKNNITIDFIKDDLCIKDDIIKALVVVIWLSNAHIFKNNINKMICSHFIGLYYGTIYLSDINTSKSLK